MIIVIIKLRGVSYKATISYKAYYFDPFNNILCELVGENLYKI